MSDKQREAFESFVKTELGDVPVMDQGKYISPKIQKYWLVWQAAQLFEMTRRGTEAWADVSDAAAWVRAIRGDEDFCIRCGGPMKPGIATGQTVSTSGEGTCSPAGPGKIIECMKCSACGWSVSKEQTES